MNANECLFDNNVWQSWVEDANDKINDPANRVVIYKDKQEVSPEPTLDELKGKVCVYAIWENDTIRYIGKSTDGNERLIDHVKKEAHGKHHSMNALVMQSVSNGKKMSLSAAVVSRQIYSSVEENLIQRYNLKKNGWNGRIG